MTTAKRGRPYRDNIKDSVFNTRILAVHDSFEMAVTNGHEADSERSSVEMTNNDDYVLTRDAAASARLNLSHYIWLASFGFNLHPRIIEAVKGRENLSVADVGTGTGYAMYILLPDEHVD